MTEEDRALSLGCAGVSTSVRLANLKVGLDVDVRTLFESAEVLVRRWAERENRVPCRLAVFSGYEPQVRTYQLFVLSTTE